MEEHIEDGRKESVETPIDVEMTPEEELVEEELTRNEEKWSGELGRTVEEWKTNLSKYAKTSHDTMARDIGRLQREGYTQDEIHLFHAYDQLTKGSSLFYKSKFQKLVEKVKTMSGESAEDPTYCLSRVMDTLLERRVQEEEMKKAA